MDNPLLNKYTKIESSTADSFLFPRGHLCLPLQPTANATTKDMINFNAVISTRKFCGAYECK